MEWLYQSSEAKCPFYRGEKAGEIFCDGIGDATTTVFTYPNGAAAHITECCRKSWTHCAFARLLWRVHEPDLDIDKVFRA